jgi:transposase
VVSLKIYPFPKSDAFLKERDLQPHLVKGWLNPNIEDEQEFNSNVEKICDIYKSAETLEKDGTHVISTDEKMGVQAREHANPKQTMQQGQVERCDPEYIRHGTSGIIASRNVATGEIVEPMIQPTRTEEDFAKHVEQVVNKEPEAQYIFIVDNLNTHKSETLVKLVADMNGIPEESLGVKDRKGILKNMETRAEFLMDSTHNVVFVYTPKHCSWLNQIECWFGILTRRLLNKRASFVSIEDLENRIKQFIDFYNEHMRKPFKWTYTGKLLRA